VISTVTEQPESPIQGDIQQKAMKTPGSIRSLRRLGRRLKDEGQLNRNANILLHASENLATKLDIAQHEVIGLRKAIIHEKKKRKRGKALQLFEEGDNPAQARFFSPEKIARIRQRNAAIEQEERQRQLDKQDMRLQGAISRAEKAREVEEKRAARQLARQSAREQAAREKQEKRDVREAQRAERAAEATKRKLDAEEKRAQRLQVKEAKEKATGRRKRPLEEDGVTESAKRPRLEPSTEHNAGATQDSSILSDFIEVRLNPPTKARKKASPEAVSLREEANAQNVRVARSGRAIQLPMRYKE
jgi:hypothetical protein